MGLGTAKAVSPTDQMTESFRKLLSSKGLENRRTCTRWVGSLFLVVVAAALVLCMRHAPRMPRPGVALGWDGELRGAMASRARAKRTAAAARAAEAAEYADASAETGVVSRSAVSRPSPRASDHDPNFTLLA